MPEIECTKCGWQGYIPDLVCASGDVFSSTPLNEIIFNMCPDCGSSDIEDYED
jgi:predicted nucleic-acid-binding Zn-ribbon protein